ncbi:MAG: ATP-binding cassette domain-containing protein [Provencibacterium sp.]|jgi:ABC-2 type transport system ATP-binding protein|nr:ATP-binding cassette domain-containing protein [Provencibacterium sp.]
MQTSSAVLPALETKNVTKIYCQWQRSAKLRDIGKNLLHPEKREVRALDGLSLKVLPGECVAYAGANGAGKSTTIKILSGILRPTSGEVSVLGMNPARGRIPLMRKIGVLFGQRTELWWDHPIITSFEWKKQVWDIPEETYRRQLQLVSELLGLSELLNTFARELSLGQRMRADLGLMLLHDPELLFLDEPTLGLDVLAKRDMISFLRRINAEGKTIVVTSHDMDDLEEIARRIVLLDHGKIAFDGTFDALREVQGSAGRIRVTAAPGICFPELPGLRPVGREGDIHEYAFDRTKTGIRDILRLLSEIDGVEDVELRHAPIEEVVAGLYRSWKNGF